MQCEGGCSGGYSSCGTISRGSCSCSSGCSHCGVVVVSLLEVVVVVVEVVVVVVLSLRPVGLRGEGMQCVGRKSILITLTKINCGSDEEFVKIGTFLLSMEILEKKKLKLISTCRIWI